MIENPNHDRIQYYNEVFKIFSKIMNVNLLFVDSRISSAFRILHSACTEIFMADDISKFMCSFLAIDTSNKDNSSTEGEGILIPKHLDRTGSITFDAELHISMSLQ